MSHRRCCDERDNVWADIRGSQELEEAMKIFSKTIDAQCDQPLNVAAAFEAVKKSVKTTSHKIVREAVD